MIWYSNRYLYSRDPLSHVWRGLATQLTAQQSHRLIYSCLPLPVSGESTMGNHGTPIIVNPSYSVTSVTLLCHSSSYHSWTQHWNWPGRPAKTAFHWMPGKGLCVKQISSYVDQVLSWWNPSRVLSWKPKLWIFELRFNINITHGCDQIGFSLIQTKLKCCGARGGTENAGVENAIRAKLQR